MSAGYDAAVLPAGVRSRIVEVGIGLAMRVLEAGGELKNRTCVVLLHGFSELAYSWRKVMPDLPTDLPWSPDFHLDGIGLHFDRAGVETGSTPIGVCQQFLAQHPSAVGYS
jgi:hypothetical protein